MSRPSDRRALLPKPTDPSGLGHRGPGHRRISVLREPLFARFFASQAVSTLGDGLAPTALTLSLLAGGYSSADLGAVLGLPFLPRLLLLTGGGVWADRVAKTRLIASSSAVRALAQTGTAALLLAHGPVAAIVGCQLLYGGAAAFTQPATAGYVPVCVAPDRLQAANGLLSTWTGLAYVVGPAAAGAIAALFSAPIAVALDGVSFLAGAGLVVSLPDPSAGGARSSGPGAVVEGWQAVRRRGWLLHESAASASIVCFTAAPFLVVGATLVTTRWGGGAWALLATAFGAGELLGSFAAGRLGLSRPLLGASLLLLLMALPPAALALGGGPPVLAAVELAAGTALGAYGVWVLTTIQRQVPLRLLSRILAIGYVGSFSGFPLGMALGPIAAARVGAAPLLAFGSAWTVLAAASLLANPQVRDLRADAA